MKSAFKSFLQHCAALSLAALAATGIASPAHADPIDINAASRSVVRIVLVAEDNGRVYYVGHGSGVAVSDTMIVTNAHLVETMQEDKSIRIGIIPSQGKKSFGGKVVAVSPRNDLALIKLDTGRLPAATLYVGPPSDGEDVVAIGYPGAVDRAQGLQVGQLIEPMAPVKTPGVISGGRSTSDFDTLLHTAALASGNSGGPLVDACGRVLGINSFGSLSDGNDAEFGFAVSNRELISFLKSAKIDYQTVDIACSSGAELTVEEAERRRLEMADLQARNEARRANQAARTADALRNAERQIAERRENQIAIAAVLLGLAVLAGGAAFVFIDRSDATRGKQFGAGAGALLLGAVIVFLLRPSYNDAKDIAAETLERDAEKRAARIGLATGEMQCSFVPDRSRLTVSTPAPVALNWTASGCFNDRTQYGRNGARWTRVFVPNDSETVSVNSFDPESGEFRIEQFLLGIGEIEALREIRSRYKNDQCSIDPDILAEIEDMQQALRQVLPRQPNEVLVYTCHAPSGSSSDALDQAD